MLTDPKKYLAQNSGAVQKGGGVAIKVCNIQSEEPAKLFAPSDCNEWLGEIAVN